MCQVLSLIEIVRAFYQAVGGSQALDSTLTIQMFTQLLNEIRQQDLRLSCKQEVILAKIQANTVSAKSKEKEVKIKAPKKQKVPKVKQPRFATPPPTYGSYYNVTSH